MYKNVIIDLKPLPVLEELITDLTNKMLAQKSVLDSLEEYNSGTSSANSMMRGLRADIRLLNEVIERCYAQQELINLRSEQIIGLN
jgi:hypothetical protein